MGIIELPAWRLRGLPSPDRIALRAGVAVSRPLMRVVRPLPEATAKAAFCDRCAAPIEFGAVMNGYGAYCSVECSLKGSNRPAQ